MPTPKSSRKSYSEELLSSMSLDELAEVFDELYEDHARECEDLGIKGRPMSLVTSAAFAPNR